MRDLLDDKTRFSEIERSPEAIGANFLSGDIMSKEAFQLTGAAAQLYEDQKVPAMFGPLAEATLARHGVRDEDAVLSGDTC